MKLTEYLLENCPLDNEFIEDVYSNFNNKNVGKNLIDIEIISKWLKKDVKDYVIKTFKNKIDYKIEENKIKITYETFKILCHIHKNEETDIILEYINIIDDYLTNYYKNYDKILCVYLKKVDQPKKENFTNFFKTSDEKLNRYLNSKDFIIDLIIILMMYLVYTYYYNKQSDNTLYLTYDNFTLSDDKKYKIVLYLLVYFIIFAVIYSYNVCTENYYDF